MGPFGGRGTAQLLERFTPLAHTTPLSGDREEGLGEGENLQRDEGLFVNPVPNDNSRATVRYVVEDVSPPLW